MSRCFAALNAGTISFLFSKAAKKKEKEELPRDQKWKGSEEISWSVPLPGGRISSNPLLRGVSLTCAQRPPAVEIPQKLLRRSVFVLPLLAMMRSFLMSNLNLPWWLLSLLFLIPSGHAEQSIPFFFGTDVCLKTAMHLSYLFLRLNNSSFTFSLKEICYKFLITLHFAGLSLISSLLTWRP